MKLISKMLEFMESEEGDRAIKEWAQKINNERAILHSQLERFNKKYHEVFSEIVDKITTKYNSAAYINRWYERGIEPPENLYWFLFEYAETYGREPTKEEYLEHGNMFTTEMYFINGYYFGRMDGQGSCIKISKQ
jgi:hypothetical protein